MNLSNSFEIIIQLGAILFSCLFCIGKELLASRELSLKVLAAFFIPHAIIGFCVV
jgi:hypothetical protein